MKIEKYRPDYYERWNKFIDISNNGNIFHKLDFLSYHGDKFKNNEHNLVWIENEEIIAVMPFAIFEIEGELIGRSPYGASYGGIIYKQDISFIKAEQIFIALKEYCLRESIGKLIITNTPTFYHLRHCEYFDFIFLMNNGKLVNSDLTAYIQINEKTQEYFDRSCKKAIRKSIKNELLFEQNNHLESFYEILLINREKHNAKPVHTKADLEYLINTLNDQVKLFMIYYNNIPIAGSIVFICNNHVLLDFYWAHLEEYKHLRPVNYLVYKMSNWALEKGYKIFDFGTQTVNMKPNYGNTRFKETFGSRGLLRKTYELNFKPS